tara:strand:+ start:699 stop:866 length:168 start_codon:yes stop_codon:yes gene_type:complete
MKKRLTYILIFSLMLFTTSGWGNVLQAAYCDPTTSVAADHMEGRPSFWKNSPIVP